MTQGVISAGQRLSAKGFAVHSQPLAVLLISSWIAIALTILAVPAQANPVIGKSALGNNPSDPVAKEQWKNETKQQHKSTPFTANSFVNRENSIVLILEPGNSEDKRRTEEFSLQPFSQEGTLTFSPGSSDLSRKPISESERKDSSKQLEILPLNEHAVVPLRFPSFSPELDERVGNRFSLGPLSVLEEFGRHHFDI